MDNTNIIIGASDLIVGDRLSMQLTDLKYHVTVVNNGKSLQKQFEGSHFDFCLLDFKIKDHNFIEIMRFLKLKHPSVVVIILVDPVDLLEKYNLDLRDLFKLGVTEIVQSFNDFDAIRGVLDGHLSFSQILRTLPEKKSEKQSEEVELIKLDSEFTSIALDQFVGGKSILFDVYIKLGSSKYLKILHGGESFEKAVINKYKDKGVKELFFSNTDRGRYIKFCQTMLDKLLEIEGKHLELKINLTRGMVEKHVEEFYFKDIKKPIFNQSVAVIDSVYNILNKEKQIGSYLKTFRELSTSNYSHTFLVTLFSCSIIQGLYWDSKISRDTVSMGALLHDIGKIKLPKEVANKNVSELTPEEWEIYSKHPILGSELVNNEKAVNSATTQIILYHHETRDGKGFPNNLKGSKIPVSAEVVGFANYFVDFIVPKKLSPIEGISIIHNKRICTDKYSPEIMQALIRLFVSK
jgi:response regulator RpfG family c-di-GMP phosphodiesterase